MSNVYKATDPILERTVAVKILAEHLSDDERFVARFRREALAVAKLIHPNIVQVYDTGVDEGRHYIVMEYVEGRSGAQILQRQGPLEPEIAAEIGVQACAGLDYAHRRGIIHRDVKPGNLMIVGGPVGGGEMTVKLTDFGIARAIEQTRITQVGSVVGTAAYLAPEQVRGEEATPATDVYALGVVLYQFLTGRLPYEGSSLAELAVRQQNEQPLPPEHLQRRGAGDRSARRCCGRSRATRAGATRAPTSSPAACGCGLEGEDVTLPDGRGDRGDPRARRRAPPPPATSTAHRRTESGPRTAPAQRSPRGRGAAAPRPPRPPAPAAPRERGAFSRFVALRARASSLVLVARRRRAVIVTTDKAAVTYQRRPATRSTGGRRSSRTWPTDTVETTVVEEQRQRTAPERRSSAAASSALPGGVAPAEDPRRGRRRSAPASIAARAPAISSLHVGEVVEDEQADRGQLLGPREVAEVVAVVARAGRAGAALDERARGRRPSRPCARSRRKRALGLGASATPWRASRVGTAQSKTSRPRAIPASRSSTSPIPSRCLGASSGSSGAVIASTAAHLLLVAAEGAADRDPVDAGRRDRLGRLAPQVLVDAALDDPEDGLPRRALALVPGEAAVEPAVGALRRARGVVAVGVEGRALVEDEGDVGAERRLHLHRDLGRDEQLGAVAVGAEAHPLLADLEHRAVLAAGAAPLPLTSSATPPWASEKTWKPPESVISARSQPMKPCRPPAAAIRSGPGETNRW